MRFPKVVVTAEVLSPPHFEKDTHSVEYREDPLTGVPCRINIRRTARPQQVPEQAELGFIARKPEDCPFCPQNIEQATPLLPRAIFAGGRINRGECCLFPNLFPLAEYHANVTLSQAHFLELDQFQTETIADSLFLAREYALRVYEHDKGARYPVYVWNHLLPSAASIIHPHVQVLVDRRPTAYQRRLLQSSREYFAEVGRNFWRDIVEEERKRGERYIGGDSLVSVIASYAPQGNREVQIIFEGIGNLAELTEEQIRRFADCINRILRGYKQMGVNSFNVSTFSGAVGEKQDYYSLHAKTISRPFLQPFYRNDSGILERLHQEADIEMVPETLAQRLRAFF